MLTGGGDIPTHVTETLGTFTCSEAAGHLLFDLHHTHIAFRLVLVKRHGTVIQERQHLPCEVSKTTQQVPRRSGCRTASFFALLLVWRWQKEGGLTALLDPLLLAPLQGFQPLRQHAGGLRAWCLHCRGALTQPCRHVVGP